MTYQYTVNDYILPEDVKKVILAVPQKSKHPERDALLIETGWETAGRISEVLELVPEHVLETSIVLKNLKQQKKRGGKVPTKIVEVSAELCQWLKRYCEQESIGRGEWVFPAVCDKTKHLGRDQVQDMITQASEAAQVYRLGKMHPRTGGRYKGISFHVLRHSYATYLLKKTENMRLVQQQLGHKNIQSTQKYANIAFADVRGKVAKAGVNLYHQPEKSYN